MGQHEAEPLPTYYLNASDRCDQRECDARAYWRFVHRATLSELDFCGHHGLKVYAVIDLEAYLVFDEREQANVKLESGAHD